MDAAERLTVQRGIAATIDYPSVYMGGPSQRAMKLADSILGDLEAAGRLVSARCSHSAWVDYRSHGTHCPTCSMKVYDAETQSKL